MRIFQIIIIGTILCLTNHSTAQEKNKGPRVYLEVRPLQFILDGYSFVAHYALNERNQIGITVFSATLSEGITDFVWDSRGSLDLEARQDIVLSFSYRYFLNKDKLSNGWFVGAATGVELYSLTNLNTNEELDYTFYFLAPRIGYMLYPLKKKIPNLFMAAELVAVFPLINDGTVDFNSGASTEINSVLPSPLIGMGYRF